MTDKGASMIEPVAWCVRYDGPPSYKGIHSDPTMYKPEAEALANRAGLVLVPLVPADALAALQSELSRETFRKIDQIRINQNIRRENAQQAERIITLKAKLAEAVGLLCNAREELIEAIARLKGVGEVALAANDCSKDISAFLEKAREVMG